MTPTPLDERMKLHKPGQVTWPGPQLKKYCDACRHFYTGDVKPAGKGRCDLVKLNGGKGANGVAYTGAEGIACPQFDAGEHRLNRREARQ